MAGQGKRRPTSVRPYAASRDASTRQQPPAATSTARMAAAEDVHKHKGGLSG